MRPARRAGGFLIPYPKASSIEGVDRAVPKEGTVSRSRRLVILVGLLAIVLAGTVRTARPQPGGSAPTIDMTDPAADTTAPPSLTGGETPPRDANLPAPTTPAAVDKPLSAQADARAGTRARRAHPARRDDDPRHGQPGHAPAQPRAVAGRERDPRPAAAGRERQPAPPPASAPATPFALDAASLAARAPRRSA